MFLGWRATEEQNYRTSRNDHYVPPHCMDTLSHTYSLLKDSWMLFSRMLYFDGIRGRSEFYAQAFLTPRNRQYRNGHSQEN